MKIVRFTKQTILKEKYQHAIVVMTWPAWQGFIPDIPDHTWRCYFTGIQFTSVLEFMIEMFVLREYQSQLFPIRITFFPIPNVYTADMSAIPLSQPLSRLNLE